MGPLLPKVIIPQQLPMSEIKNAQTGTDVNRALQGTGLGFEVSVLLSLFKMSSFS